MPLNATGSKPVKVPLGTHAGRCIDVIDAGWWAPGKMAEDQTEPIHKCKLRFFFVGEDPDTGEARGFAVDTPLMTLSIGKKSKLGEFLERWRGEPFTDKERLGFDVERLENVTAFISVAQREGSDYVDVVGAMSVPKNMQHGIPYAPEDYVKDRDREKPLADGRDYETVKAKILRQPAAPSAPPRAPAAPAPAPSGPVMAEQGRAAMRQAAVQQQAARPAAAPEFPTALQDDEDDLPFSPGA